MNLLEKHIPKQQVGVKTCATAERKLSSHDLAIKLFNAAKIRLTDVNQWFKIAGSNGAEFQLTDAFGQEINSFPVTGNLIRIKLPGPPNKMGDGFDWVRIEKFEDEKKISEEEEIYGFRVRPVKNPLDNTNKSAHFYTNDATNSFLVYRKKNIVYVVQRGRNEVPNPSGSLFNKIRNIIIAIPAMLGLSKPQWLLLVAGILGK